MNSMKILCQVDLGIKSNLRSLSLIRIYLPYDSRVKTPIPLPRTVLDILKYSLYSAMLSSIIETEKGTLAPP